MKFVPLKTNAFVKKIFHKLTWDIDVEDKSIFLTFDDGPTPEITNWVLNTLSDFNAKATFFCIGKNIEQHPNLFQSILNQGHSIGNHTHNHLNLWKTNTETYKADIQKAEETIGFYKKQHLSKTNNFTQQNNKSLFRPPYGKINPKMGNYLLKLDYKIIMWDVLSYDWDKKTTPQECYQNVTKHSKPGSIIVFHDSVKASKNLKYTLPKVLALFSEKGYRFLAMD